MEDRNKIISILTSWEQFRKENWFESEAIDVEKFLINDFTTLYINR